MLLQNCAIKPPAPAVLRDRHRRLCIPCSKAPLGTLVNPPLQPDTPVDADEMRRALCSCESEGVWLCQPCGRSIRGADHDYKAYVLLALTCCAASLPACPFSFSLPTSVTANRVYE